MLPTRDTPVKLLERCTVFLSVDFGRTTGTGTGFFVAPGTILTCAHVVEDAKQISVEWGGQKRDASILNRFVHETTPRTYPDLAVLRADFQEHPCVALHRDVEVDDHIYAWGYPKDYKGDPLTTVIEGESGPPAFLKFKEGRVESGVSGSPMLNLRTGGVCGMIVLSRDQNSAEGGRGLSTNKIASLLPEIFTQNEYLHICNDYWLATLSATQKLEGGWNRSIVNLKGAATIPELEPLLSATGFGRGRAFAAVPVTGSIVLIVTSTGALSLDTQLEEIRWELFCPSTCAAVSPNRDLVAFGVGRHVMLWSLAIGQRIANLTIDSGSVEQLVFSPDSQLLAGVIDTMNRVQIQLWRAEDGESLALLDTKRAYSPGVIAFSEDGRVLAATTLGSNIHRWSTGGGQFLPKLRLPWLKRLQMISYEALIFYRKTIIAAGSRLFQWNIQDGEFSGELDGSADGCPITALAVDRSRGRLAEGDQAGRIWLRSLATGLRAATAFSHQAPLVYLSFSDDGQSLVSLSKDNIANLSRPDSETQPQNLNLARLGIGYTHLALNPTGEEVARTEDSGKWTLVSAENGSILVSHPLPLTGHPNPLILADNATIVFFYETHIVVMNKVDGDIMLSVPTGPSDKYRFSPDSRTLAIVSEDAINFWSLIEKRKVWEEKIAGFVQDFAISPDGKTLVVLSIHGIGDKSPRSLKLFSAVDGSICGSANASEENGSSLVFTADSSLIITFDVGLMSKGNMSFWDAETGAFIDLAKRRWFALFAVGYLVGVVSIPRTRKIALIGSNRSVTIVDLEDVTQQNMIPQNPWNTHLTEVPRKIEVSCDGRLCAIGGAQGVLIWDLLQGEEVIRLPYLVASDFRFSADNKILTTLANTGYVRRWKIQ